MKINGKLMKIIEHQCAFRKGIENQWKIISIDEKSLKINERLMENNEQQLTINGNQ